MASLISSYFDKKAVVVIEGGVKETTEILKYKFDIIFYTGSSNVGKIIMKAGSKHLSKMCLELGGKCGAYLNDDRFPFVLSYDSSSSSSSPSSCLPSRTINKDFLAMAAKRIAWAKWTWNSGQTCVSVDYLLVQKSQNEMNNNRGKSMEDELIDLLINYIHSNFGSDPLSNNEQNQSQKGNEICKIIDENHFNRLIDLLDDPSIQIVHGGRHQKETRKIEPTIVKAKVASKVMQTEIFGPILPIIEVEDGNEAIRIIKTYGKPLALYVFTNQENLKQSFKTRTSYGSLLFNDTMSQVMRSQIPFGGVGESGMGVYHGVHGLKTFSHKKPIFSRTDFELDVKYPPYPKGITNLVIVVPNITAVDVKYCLLICFMILFVIAAIVAPLCLVFLNK